MYVESYVESERGDDYFEQNKKLGTPSSSWPEGIKLTNNISPSGSTKIPRLFYQVNSSAVQIKRQQVRTFVWQGDDLTILFNITSIQSPLCTRLTPPLSWISASGCKVRLLHRSAQGVSAPDRSGSSDDTGENSLRTYSEEKTDDSQEKLTLVPSSSTVEIVASRSLVENTLSCLRMKGFQREDLFRLLDKGPWILAFDVRPIIPRLFHDLQHDLKLSESQAVHIISHCPYLIAQYFKYKGRDVYATARALFEAGYSQARFTEDIMRFPSMLAAPPDRIRGWQALLQGYNVATTPGIFGKLLRRAPFMFYVKPPGLDDVDKSMVPEDATATASGYVAYGALRILDLIRSLGTSDMDKVVRTQPLILLDSSEEVMRRIGFLLNLFLEDQGPLQWSDGEAGSWNRLLAGGEEGRSAQEQLSSVVLTYPAILSISYE